MKDIEIIKFEHNSQAWLDFEPADLNDAQFEAFLFMRWKLGILFPTRREINKFILYGGRAK